MYSIITVSAAIIPRSFNLLKFEIRPSHPYLIDNQNPILIFWTMKSLIDFKHDYWNFKNLKGLSWTTQVIMILVNFTNTSKRTNCQRKYERSYAYWGFESRTSTNFAQSSNDPLILSWNDLEFMFSWILFDYSKLFRRWKR